MKNSLLFLSFLAFTLTTIAQQTGDFTMTYTENGSGLTRSYYVSVPSTYTSSLKYPLIYAWHGSGMSGSDMRTLIQSVNSNINAIIVCPDVNGFTTSAELTQMLNTSYAYPFINYHIDTAKRIIAGFSMGGYYAYQIGLQNPSQFTGILGLSPAIGSTQMTTAMWNNITQVRMATIDGTADFNYTAVHSLMTSIQSQGGSLSLIEPSGVTHADQVYFTSTTFHNDFDSSYTYLIAQPSTAGVKEDALTLGSIDMFPNPATEYVELYLGSINHNNLNVELFSIDGKMVGSNNYEIQKSNESIHIQFNHLKSGVYFVRVQGQNESVTKRLVVN